MVTYVTTWSMLIQLTLKLIQTHTAAHFPEVTDCFKDDIYFASKLLAEMPEYFPQKDALNVTGHCGFMHNCQSTERTTGCHDF